MFVLLLFLQLVQLSFYLPQQKSWPKEIAVQKQLRKNNERNMLPGFWLTQSEFKDSKLFSENAHCVVPASLVSTLDVTLSLQPTPDSMQTYWFSVLTVLTRPASSTWSVRLSNCFASTVTAADTTACPNTVASAGSGQPLWPSHLSFWAFPGDIPRPSRWDTHSPHQGLVPPRLLHRCHHPPPAMRLEGQLAPHGHTQSIMSIQIISPTWKICS